MTEDYYKRIFSRNLAKLMEEKKKTQSDIIRDLKINKSTISSWCKGTRLPRMDMINELAVYFNVNKSDLIEDKDSLKHISKDKVDVAFWTGKLLKENNEYVFSIMKKISELDENDLIFLDSVLDSLLSKKKKD